MTVLLFMTQIKNRDTPIEVECAFKGKVIFCVRGVASPVLANVALDGMERLFGAENDQGKPVPPSLRRGPNRGIGLVRYADDRVPRTY
jgi:hypothetical protein